VTTPLASRVDAIEPAPEAFAWELGTSGERG